MLTDAVVPDRFRDAVTLHLLKQSLHLDGIPLILGIHGPPGTGKTYQCEAVLRDLGCHVLPIGGGQLESQNAGEPAELIRSTYVAAGKLVRSGTVAHAAVVLNDFDAGCGDWGDLVQTTVNTQTVLSELMHLCDFPTVVGGSQAARVPIIVTGNDFSKVYVPLRRPGRMSLFEWSPGPSERVGMLSGVFPGLAEEERERLVREFPLRQIAFFSHVATSLIERGLREQLALRGFPALSKMVAEGRLPSGETSGYAEIFRAASEIEASTLTPNHLRGAVR